MLLTKGNGKSVLSDELISFELPENITKSYSNSQLDDYRTLSRGDFKWSPPLKMSLDAIFEITENKDGSKLTGTSGFGFWNDPFMMTGLRWPTLPKALWFFYSSSESELYLNEASKGNYWRAMSLDAHHFKFFSILPLLSLSFPLFNITKFREWMWPKVRKLFKGEEKIIKTNQFDWHKYEIQWEKDYVTFSIDNKQLYRTEYSPKGPLGLVIWMDNQYLKIKPTGKIAFGSIQQQNSQKMLIKNLKIENL
jgi:hypothetical protein